MERLPKYPDFFYGEYLYTESPIILVDVDVFWLDKTCLSWQKTIDDKKPLLFESAYLANLLELALGKYLEPCEERLVVFPGNGAIDAKDSLEYWKDYNCVNVYAKRKWQVGNDPEVIVDEIFTEWPSVKEILVIDDAISSGETMKKLCEKNANKFPEASWTGACWISQKPRSKAPAGIPGFKKAIAGLVVEGPQGRRVPINSLSTLIKDQEIAQKYTLRYFQDPEKFLRILEEMREYVC